ncbi:MAG TPA: ribosome maturation factor RimM [Spirochaetota bacterium]|nr:ribosome maturation factor RimM [Spirochaetota bacterium]HPJ35464.1 ribosome maturation factor RimM [Spirochaetota bacterium]
MIPEDEYIRIARITGSHSLNGGIKIYLVTAIPERFEKGNTVYLKLNEGLKKYTVTDFRIQKDRTCLLKLDGVEDRNGADLLKGTDIFIDGVSAESFREELEEDSFFYYDIIGCRVLCRGADFGIVKDILEAGSGEILVVEDLKGKSVMIPFVDSMVNTDRIEEKLIEINPVEGLLDF